jgi:hypothetical protein
LAATLLTNTNIRSFKSQKDLLGMGGLWSGKPFAASFETGANAHPKIFFERPAYLLEKARASVVKHRRLFLRQFRNFGICA